LEAAGIAGRDERSSGFAGAKRATVKKKCPRCGKWFVPKRKHYEYCHRCYPEVAPMGGTTSRQRHGGAARIHGGVWRQTDNRLPAELRGEITSQEIVRGMHASLTDLYGCPTKVSSVLRVAGMNTSDIACLRQQRCLDRFTKQFCPRLWEWMGTTLGTKARTIVIESYGLYGGNPRSVSAIGRELGVSADHASALRGWALKNMRATAKRIELEGMLVTAARDVLESPQKVGDRDDST
jgi:hypothetical protein